MSHNAGLRAAVTAIEYHLPDDVLTNEDIARAHPDWGVDKIYDKTGIRQRHIAAKDETAADLAFQAARKLLNNGACQADEIDLVVFCTQTPDYALPTSACLLQDRLGLRTDVAAFDYNLGCSGYVYGLSIVKAMLESGQRSKALLLTGETYSKWIDPNDKSVRTIFGDAGAATLVEMLPAEAGQEFIGPFVYGTDGTGRDRLIVPASGARAFTGEPLAEGEEGLRPGCLYMDGPEIFTFTIRTVPKAYKALLEAAGKTTDDLGLVVYHQANAYMLEYLRKRSKIPPEKFVLDLEEVGNTVSNTIPIALKNAAAAGRLDKGMPVALVGFGVGYSWAAGMINWQIPE